MRATGCFAKASMGATRSSADLVPARAVRMSLRRLQRADYAELQVTTNFSFLRGASHGEELVAQAKALGLERARRHRPQHACRRRARAHRGQGGGSAAHRRRAPRSARRPSLLCLPRDRAAYGRLPRCSRSARCAPRKANARSFSTMLLDTPKARSSSRCPLRLGTGARCKLPRRRGAAPHRRRHSVCSSRGSGTQTLLPLDGGGLGEGRDAQTLDVRHPPTLTLSPCKRAWGRGGCLAPVRAEESRAGCIASRRRWRRARSISRRATPTAAMTARALRRLISSLNAAQRRSSPPATCSTTRPTGAPLQDVLTCVREGTTIAKRVSSSKPMPSGT